MLTHVFHFLKCVIPSLLTTNTNAFSFLNYLQYQFEQPTTSSVAETNHGTTRIYIAFSIFVFIFFVLYTTIVIYSFTCIVTQASQLQITL